MTECGVSSSKEGRVGDVIALRRETEGWSQTRLGLAGLHLHTWRGWNRKWAPTKAEHRADHMVPDVTSSDL